MLEKTEREIIQNWKRDYSFPLVSIRCATYNHEKYIAKCLEGFLEQITDFPFEVIVHDDASSDHTADVIREYERQYPQIIKAIYQTENQYSKENGVIEIERMMDSSSRGKYLAFCEGDDYWCDPHKLQMQIDYLESHPECVASVHNTIFLDADSNEQRIKYPDQDYDLQLKDCVLDGGQSYHTSSLVVRKEIFDKKADFTNVIDGVGDYPNAVYYALIGPIHYFGKIMSVYRVCAEGSWTQRIHLNASKMIEVEEKTLSMLQMADDYSSHEYQEYFDEAICFHEFRINILKRNYLYVIKKPEYKVYFRQLPFLDRLNIFVHFYFPFLFKFSN